VTTIDSLLQPLNGDISNLKSQVSSLQTQLTNLSSQLSTLTTLAYGEGVLIILVAALAYYLSRKKTE
jgi:prefoldin subunit 5